ncbi:DUF1345 domain-containing protein [Govanella unica]|uniref:DUF1345 domain-containing protein n=1 Tax=Govanella unica TaxID=2975056 RepID=A0A9X3TVN3_9PROT|nr:DUF1345 domain-containing protein [Govania unica]MDA5192569.1 DUF1345 domain-containing protein [Govania unica]
MAGTRQRPVIGNILFPWRFIGFVVIAGLAASLAIPALGWRHGAMVSFDLAALIFILACISLLGQEAGAMRKAAERNDANRGLLLCISVLVLLVVMVTVASELIQVKTRDAIDIAVVIATLALAWTFSNLVFALHYAHMYYSRDKDGGDYGGLIFPDTPEPDYWDFIYFAFCLGMTFQTSDTNMKSRRFRRVSTFHCLAAFVFNIGVIAFSINVLGA